MGTYCDSLVADLFLFCYERDFMKSLSRNNQVDFTEAFNSTSRYLNIDYVHFEQTIDRVYAAEHQLNKVYSSDTEELFWD